MNQNSSLVRGEETDILCMEIGHIVRCKGDTDKDIVVGDIDVFYLLRNSKKRYAVYEMLKCSLIRRMPELQ